MKQSIQKETGFHHEFKIKSINSIYDIFKIQELLKNKLSSYLREFQKLTDWPSVNNWLLKLEQAFKDHPTPYLEDKLVLAKRLSQCLNHNLPVGTHKSTLTVYKLIFNNLKLISNVDDSPDSVRKHIANNIRIFTLGLFPFFACASIQLIAFSILFDQASVHTIMQITYLHQQDQILQKVFGDRFSILKPDILDIIETHFCPLEMDLIPCSVGLVVSILPGLIENSEELQRKTFQIFEQLQAKIGKKYLYGALWLSILRLPRTRVAAYTCLAKLFKKNDQQQNVSIDIEPNIIKQLQQNNQFTQEEVFLQKVEESTETYSPFFKIYEQQRNIDMGGRYNDEQYYEEENIMNDQEIMLQKINEVKNQDDFDSRFPNKSALILNALITTLEDENNQTKKFGLDFLLNYFPILGDSLSEADKLVLTQSVLYLFLKNEYSIVWKCHQWLFGDADINSNFQIGQHNKIVIDVYIKNALINIFDHIHNDLNSPIKIIQTFYMKNNHMISDSLKTISFYLIKYIKQHFNNQEIQKSSLRLFECVYNYFDVIFASLCDYYEDLQKQSEQNPQRKDYYFNEKVYTLELIEFAFIKMFVFHSEMEFFELSKTVQPLIQRLVQYLSDEASNVVDDEHFILLRCIFQLVEYLRKVLEELERNGSDIQLLQMEQMYINYMQTFQKYYQRLCYLLTETLLEEKEQEKIKKISSSDQIDPLQSKLSSQGISQGSSSSQNQHQSQQDSNRLSEQHKESEDQTENTQKRYEECLYNMFEQSSKIILSIYKLYLGYFNWEVQFDSAPDWLDKIYSIIEITKHYFPKIEIYCIDSLIEIIIYQCKHKERFQLIQKFVEEDSKITQIIKILWTSLESSQQQKKIIDYLVIMMNKFPKLFSLVVEQSFKQSNSYKLQGAMKGFMTFYRMTNNYITKNSSSNLGCGLFQMLDLLSNKNPILRNAVKTFLMENTSLLFRVLDPFLIEFLDYQHNSKVQYKYSNLFVYEETYNCQRILYLIRLLEQTLDILKDIFVSYIFQVKISSHLQNQIKSSKFYNQFDLSNVTYLDVICNIFVRFIQGQTALDLIENRKEAYSSSYLSSDDEENLEVNENSGQKQLGRKSQQLSSTDDNLPESPRLTQKQLSRKKREQAYEEQFRLENQQVNSLCSEYLDKLIQQTENKSIVIKILNLTLEKILITLKFLISNKNLVIQVELITLIQSIVMKFKQIYKKKGQQEVQQQLQQQQQHQQQQQQQQQQQSNAQNQRMSSAFGGLKIAEESLRNAIEMFGSQLFFANLLEGFEQTDDHFVRSRYIYVITIGIWTLSDAFSDESLKDIITLIFQKYYSVLKSVQLQDIIQTVDQIDDREFHNNEDFADLSTSAVGAILQSSNLKENYFSRDRAQQGGILDSQMSFEYSKRHNKKKSKQRSSGLFSGKTIQGSGSKDGSGHKNNKSIIGTGGNSGSQKIIEDKNESISKKKDKNQSDDENEDDYLQNDQDMNLSSQSKCQEIRNICDSIKSILNYFLQFKDSSGMTFISLQATSTQSVSQAINQQQQHYKMASALYDIITLKFLNSNALMANNNPNIQNSNQVLSSDRFTYLPTLSAQNSQSTASFTGDSKSSTSSNQSNNDPLTQLNIQSLKLKQHPAACNLIMLELPNLLLSYLNCWSVSHNMESHIIFNRQGTRFYDFSQFEGYNSRLQEILNYLSNTNNDFLFQDLIKVEILSVTYPLMQQFPIQTIHAFLQLWIQQCDSSFFTLPTQRDRSYSQAANSTFKSLNADNNETIMMKILEIISYMNLNIDYLLSNLMKSPIIQSIRNYYIQRLQVPKDQALINSQIAQQESQILFFIFELISYQYIDLTSSQSQQLISSFWLQLVALLSSFNTSKHPTTCIWVLDIVLAASRKYNPKEIINEKNIRQDLHELIKIHLTNLSNFSIQKILFSSTTERNFNQMRQSIVKQNLKSNVADSAQQQPYFELFAPHSPTMSDLFENYQRNFNSSFTQGFQSFDGGLNFNSDGFKSHQQQQTELDQQQQSPIYYEIERCLFSINSSSNQSDDFVNEERRNSFCSNYSYSSQSSNHPLLTREQFTFRVSILSYKTLKSLLFEVLQNFLDTQQKILQTAKDILGPVISKVFSEKKNTNQQLILVECASDLCNRLLTQSPDFIMKEFRKNLLEIFTSNDFFKCNIRILNNWRNIVNWLDESGNLFTELFERESFFSSLLSKTEETNQKIRKFQRICFIIYSGRQDKYHKQLTLLLENIGEIIKNIQNQSHELLILVLFCLRILILRLSPRVLNELLRNTWPILLTLLLQIFDKNGTLQSSAQCASQILGSTFPTQQSSSPNTSLVNHNLVLAALKLIEQISYVQLEEFYLHQWMFVLDYFGIQIQAYDGQMNHHNLHQVQNKQKANHNQTTQNTLMQDEKLVSPFNSVPVLTSFFPLTHKVDYQNKLLDDDVSQDFSKKYRKIIFTQSHVEDIDEIQSKILFFCQYLINLNQQRWNVDLRQLESIIERDFIDFDQFIYRGDKNIKKNTIIQHM